jgi:hypothetical protein
MNAAANARHAVASAPNSAAKKASATAIAPNAVAIVANPAAKEANAVAKVSPSVAKMALLAHHPLTRPTSTCNQTRAMHEASHRVHVRCDALPSATCAPFSSKALHHRARPSRPIVRITRRRMNFPVLEDGKIKPDSLFCLRVEPKKRCDFLHEESSLAASHQATAASDEKIAWPIWKTRLGCLCRVTAPLLPISNNK